MIRLTSLPLALALAACTSGPVPLPPPDAEVRPVTQRDDIDGRWTIAAVNGTARAGLSWQLTGTDLRVGLACNGGGGTATRNGDKLFVGSLALTERACAPEIMRIDEQVASILREPVTMEYTPPDRLRLVNAGGTLDLVRNRS